ncbi:hypothetical protein [Gordonia sp. DT101]|uniref:hypothetical protein n=1 Tax=Gordonia sp. DT101 TaxID=3416545 RepID=UPI003CEB8D45
MTHRPNVRRWSCVTLAMLIVPMASLTQCAAREPAPADKPIPAASSSTGATSATTRTSIVEVTTPVGVAPEDIDGIDLDLDGDPCNGVSNVDIDGIHYDCDGGVFRRR